MNACLTVCMYSAQFHLSGGIETAVRELHRIFPVNGGRVVLAVEHGQANWIAASNNLCLSGPLSERAGRWTSFIKCHGITCVVFHHVDRSDYEKVSSDIRLLKSLGVKCIKMNHSSFVSPWLISGNEETHLWDGDLAKLCDAVFCVSEIDAKWWSALGFKSRCVLLPVSRQRSLSLNKQPAVNVTEHALRLLWAGRPVEPKQPELAIEAFVAARRLGANVELTMVGGGNKHWRKLRSRIRREHLSRFVSFFSARDDLDPLWEVADVHLLTSATESFGLVLAEAKARGIPSIVFDIPYNKMISDREGMIVVPQDDVSAMAKAIASLASDRAKLGDLAIAAQQSIVGQTDTTVAKDWWGALEGVTSGADSEMPDRFLSLIVAQQQWAWARYCRRNVVFVRMEEHARLLGCSFTCVAKALSMLVSSCRWLRKLF